MELSHVYLGLAIVAETLATTAMKSTEGFTRFWPSLVTVLGYGCAFYGLSRTLETLPIGIAYALWSGVGMVLISLLAWWVHGQRLDAPALIGIGFILLGVVVINVFSKSVAH
ncbi:SMR family transporter [Curvibacter sp. HBC61]|uniref:SMR family transporter n=1 Tax=Curvibacter cyanobacteriorum TaxID=3026422 RepID=A0ABT5MXE5_9BURK|nr:SMR family transporter [Curvibacter sp. HBC61]MDD0837457.1 SMR family transporter [Curvibacter sp. HBC61]